MISVQPWLGCIIRREYLFTSLVSIIMGQWMSDELLIKMQKQCRPPAFQHSSSDCIAVVVLHCNVALANVMAICQTRAGLLVVGSATEERNLYTFDAMLVRVVL